jgi:hypothetical protein
MYTSTTATHLASLGATQVLLLWLLPAEPNGLLQLLHAEQE